MCIYQKCNVDSAASGVHNCAIRATLSTRATFYAHSPEEAGARWSVGRYRRRVGWRRGFGGPFRQQGRPCVAGGGGAGATSMVAGRADGVRGCAGTAARLGNASVRAGRGRCGRPAADWLRPAVSRHIICHKQSRLNFFFIKMIIDKLIFNHHQFNIYL